MKSILREYASDPDLAVLGGRVELYNPLDEPMTVRTLKQRMEVSLTPFEVCSPPIIGCNVAFARRVIESVGYFDPDLGPGSDHQLVAEDVDFIYRVSKQGFKIVYSPEVLVYHNHGRSVDSQSVCRNYVRGRGAFYCKHALKKDVAVMKMAYWEALGATKRFLQKVLSGKLTGSELALLWNLGMGAIYEFRARSPKIFNSTMPGTR
jgi:GT2 family glycosyltransferase